MIQWSLILEANVSQKPQVGWPLPYFLPPYFQPHAWTTPIFKLCFYFDLSFTAVKLCDCSFDGCEVIALTNIFSQINTDIPGKILKTTSAVVPTTVGVDWTTFGHDDAHTHSQGEINTSSHDVVTAGNKRTKIFLHKTQCLSLGYPQPPALHHCCGSGIVYSFL